MALTGAGLGQAALNVPYQGIGTQAGVNAVPAPKTIAGAASKLDDLNNRLSNVTSAVAGIANQIGAISGLPGAANVKAEAPSEGSVGRLNDQADAAHRYLSEIEALLSGISRALG